MMNVFKPTFGVTVMTAILSQQNPSTQGLGVLSCPPQYGVNYNAGYVGFTYTTSNLVSRGIAYFTRWTKMHQISVSHALLVTGENQCIEAHAQGGVKRTNLDTYFEDEHCQIFFRKPLNLSPEIAARLVSTAEEHLGCGYDFNLIAAQLEANSLTGRLFRRLLGKSFEERVCQLKDHPERWICSELVAHCLDSQPEYLDTGVLANNDCTIDPQELFEDDLIFTAWHHTNPAS